MKIAKLSCAAVLGLIANATGTLAASASDRLPSTSTPVSSSQVAQAVGECRRTGRAERIYSAADLASTHLLDVPTGTTVTVAGLVNQPSFGWLRISYPTDGYILTAFLQRCGTPTPTPSPVPSPAPSPTPSPTPSPAPSASNACGIVTVDALTVRTEPSTEADSIDSIPTDGGFRIIGGPRTQTSPPEQRGRIWLHISRNGRSGWIPETGPFGSDSGINIRRANCSDIGIR